MTVSTWPLAPRQDGSRVSVVVDDGRLAIVGPDCALGLAPGEAAQLGALLTRVSETDVDQLPPCRCVVCQTERAEGLRP